MKLNFSKIVIAFERRKNKYSPDRLFFCVVIASLALHSLKFSFRYMRENILWGALPVRARIPHNAGKKEWQIFQLLHTTETDLGSDLVCFEDKLN